MKGKPPIDLVIKSMSCKVSAGAQERLKRIADDNGLKIQDVLSVCLLYMPEDEIVRIIEQQSAALQQLSPEAQSMLRKIDKLSDAERSLLREQLS